MKDFLFEYYTKHPVTGEGGSEIKAGWLRAESSVRALALIRAQPLYDKKIELYAANMNPGDSYAPFIIPYDFIRAVARRFMEVYPDMSQLGEVEVDHENLLYTFNDRDVGDTYEIDETDLLEAFSLMFDPHQWPDHLSKPPMNANSEDWKRFWEAADGDYEYSDAFSKLAIWKGK